MRTITLKLFLSAICIVFTLQAGAQTCTGSLGDPVINQDFKYGRNPGIPLSQIYTNYVYVPMGCPNDGMYTIANSIDTCFGSTWHKLSHDHTGNPNGYMM